jgi:hypothetical protein
MKKRHIKGLRGALPSPKAKEKANAITMDQPTAEQAGRVEYVRQQVRDEMGHHVGFAYRRRPLFETMAAGKANAITIDELAALRFYRTAFDRCDQSATKSCLNVGVGGARVSGNDPTSATPAILEAKRKLRLCEEAMGGQVLTTMRAVVLDDRSFSEIAIERFGGRNQDWIIVDEPVFRNGKPVTENGKPVTKTVHRERIAPRSGRHRQVVSDEFRIGLRALTDRVRSLVSRPGIEELWIESAGKGASIRRGVCAPNGLYRRWGSSIHIDGVLAAMRGMYGETLSFMSASAAQGALEAADTATGNHLSQLASEELVA